MRIRLNSSAITRTDSERLLFLQIWPGARAEGDHPSLAPIVVIDTGLGAGFAIRLAMAADEVGAAAKRLMPENGIPFWFGAGTALVCRAETGQRVLRAYPDFPSARIFLLGDTDADSGFDHLLADINEALSSGQKLRLPGSA